jgi:hypothetical protein
MVHFGACVSFKSGPCVTGAHAGLHRRMRNGAERLRDPEGQGSAPGADSGSLQDRWKSGS